MSRSGGPLRRPLSAHARMRTEFGSWDVVAAKWVLGLLPSDALPRIAVDALEAGPDTPSLRQLAGELHPTLSDSGWLFETVLDEIQVALPDRSRSGLVLARACAARITDGTLTPYEGARQIWQIELHVDGLMAELGAFVYWASEWEEADSSARRQQCEAAIRMSALDLAGAP